MISNIFNIVLPAFIAISIGFLFGKFRSKTDISALVDIAFNIATPALTLISMLDKNIVLLDASKIWAAAMIIMLGCWGVAWLVFKLLKQQHSGLYLPIAIMNTVNIPFPIIYLAYGAEGLLIATLFFLPNIILLYTLGIYVAAGKNWREGIKEIFRVPIIYAAVAGLVLNLLNVKLPDLAMNSLNLIAQMCVPLILIVLGYNLSKVKLASVPTTLLASFLRIGVGLLIGVVTVILLNLEGISKSVVILDSAMPAAVNAAIIATHYNNESDLVSSVVFMTTIISLISIPFLLQIMA